MLNFFKNNAFTVFLCVFICIFLYLSRSYYHKSESFKSELNAKIEKEIKINVDLKTKIVEYSINIERLKTELIKKNKKTTISIKKLADGSSTKDIVIDDNFEQNSFDKEAIKEDKKDTTIELKKEEQTKEKIEVEQKVEIKKEEEKQSSTNSVFLIIGGVAVCLLSGICAF